MPKFEIKKAVNNQFYFVFKAGNGETIATSETYKSKQSCNKGIRILIEGIQQATPVTIKDLT